MIDSIRNMLKHFDLKEDDIKLCTIEVISSRKKHGSDTIYEFRYRMTFNHNEYQSVTIDRIDEVEGADEDSFGPKV